MAHTSLSDSALRELTARLKRAQEQFAKNYPGEAGTRQPVHTVYGGAQLFKSDTTKKLGELSDKALQAYAPDAAAFAEALGLEPALGVTGHGGVVEKLKRRAAEGFRIDFEDGYGSRPDAEED